MYSALTAYFAVMQDHYTIRTIIHSHDAFICATWCIHKCGDMTHSYV